MKIVTRFRIALIAVAACAAVNAYAEFFMSGGTSIKACSYFLGTAAMIYLIVMTYSRLERPFRLMNECAEQMNRGDLTGRVCYESKDEIGELIGKQQAVISSLTDLLQSVDVTALNITKTVNALSSGAEETSRDAQDQSGQSQQIATAAEEMSQTIADIVRTVTSATEATS